MLELHSNCYSYENLCKYSLLFTPASQMCLKDFYTVFFIMFQLIKSLTQNKSKTKAFPGKKKTYKNRPFPLVCIATRF